MSEKFAGLTVLLLAIATLISQSAMDAFATMFVMAFIWMLLEKKRLSYGFQTLGWNKVILVWFAVFAGSLIVNFSTVETANWFKLFDFRWLLLAMMMGSALYLNPPTPKTWKAIQVSFFVCSAFAILVFVLKKNPIYPNDRLDLLADGTVRTGGFLLQPIVFAHLYALWICLFVGIWLVIFDNNPRKAFSRTNFFLHLAIVSGTLAVLLSFTRGVWLALFWALFAMFFVVRKKLAFAFLLAIGVAATALVATWGPVRERVLQSFNSQDSERLWIWKANFEIFKDYPVLGPGYNQNVSLLPEYFQKIQAPEGLMNSHAHNQFLHVLAGAGALGLLAYLAFWIFMATVSLRIFQEQRSKSLIKAGISLGVFGAIVVFSLGGITESNYVHSKIRYTWALLVALLIWARSPQTSGPVPKK